MNEIITSYFTTLGMITTFACIVLIIERLTESALKRIYLFRFYWLTLNAFSDNISIYRTWVACQRVKLCGTTEISNTYYRISFESYIPEITTMEQE